MTTIGTRIRKIRESKNISQESMAMELILTQSTYGRLEKNDSRLTVPKLIKISQVLEVSIPYLFGEELSNNSERVNVQENDFSSQVNREYINTLKEEIAFLRKLIELQNK
ncbi:transcriptional regulator with XRE-family HTH domain [Flavobacterium sp. 90]|uniref:helix-turn-helix domain-containing protein n=1 Tax=unclassified Flavobacterium TaxID=196869 RepID=UPI000EAF4F99|nr:MULTISPECIES: helix-turn-helix transcriptional regulator [unclassified Flavobacterium]RKR05127.1 transcriptional regulator with XRE-family HTH domain [Flavobacterium sp. 81]TCK56442.1 transcriptional regulator with XRE-family HTH domain [Flavobacterium sp. 90]